jgi:hypothetical protein
MAQSGYTPILIYASGTATNVPLAANMTSTSTGAELAINYADGKLYYKNSSNVVTLLASTSGASGDVVGPASATDNALARFDLTTGKLIQNSVGILSDAGILTGLTGLTSSGSITFSSLTSGRVTFAGASGLLTDSAALTFDGTNLSVTSPSTATTFTLADNGGRLVVLKNSLGTGGPAEVGTTTNHDFYVRAGAGAAGLNSLYLQAGGVTGYSLSYAGLHAWFNGATQAMTLNTSGNLGIGTSSPANVLNVKSATQYKGVQVNNATNTIAELIGFNASNEAGGLKLYNAASPTVQILSDGISYLNGGNVGIGTSSPTSLLHLAATNPTMLIRATTVGYSYTAYANDGGNFYVGRDSSTGGAFGKAYCNVVWGDSAFATVFATNNTERMRLDSAGNLGLGVTPSAWSGHTILQTGAWASFGSFTGNLNSQMMNNAYWDGGAYRYIGSDSAAYYSQTSGVHGWYNAASGTAGNAVTFTQAMILNASGNLGIGTTSPNSKLEVAATVDPVITINGTDLTQGNRAALFMAARNVNGNSGNVSIEAISVNNQQNDMVFRTGSTAIGSFGTERMRIDTSGNVGIGATSPVAKLQVKGSGTSGQVSASFILENSSSGTGGMDITGSAGASRWRFLYGGGPSTGTNALTEAMCIGTEGTSAGLVGIGTSAPYTKLHVLGTIKTAPTNQSGVVAFGGTTDATTQLGIFRGAANSTSDGNFLNIAGYEGLTFSVSAANIGSQVERMRITNSGYLVMAQINGDGPAGQIQAGVTSTTSGLNGIIAISATSSGAYPYYGNALSATQGLAGWGYLGTTVGSITISSGVTILYNTTSDYRLKEDVQPMVGSLAKVTQLKPVTYKWKANGADGQGFIAHELAEVIPDCVTGEKDAVDENGKPKYQGVDTSFLVATLVSAIQEQQALIESLTTRLTALENK